MAMMVGISITVCLPEALKPPRMGAVSSPIDQRTWPLKIRVTAVFARKISGCAVTIRIATPAERRHFFRSVHGRPDSWHHWPEC